MSMRNLFVRYIEVDYMYSEYTSWEATMRSQHHGMEVFGCTFTHSLCGSCEEGKHVTSFLFVSQFAQSRRVPSENALNRALQCNATTLQHMCKYGIEILNLIQLNASV